jgi:Flp pilus assembly protein TadD
MAVLRALAGFVCLTASLGLAQTSTTYQRARAAFDSHDYAEAAPLFARAESEDPGHSDALLYEGKALANLGRFGEADGVLHQYVLKHPESADALYMLGFVLNRENKPADSLTIYTQAARLTTPKSDDLKIVAMDYVVLNDYPDAIRWMEKAVAFDPHNEEAWYGLGRCYYSQSRFPEAEHAFQQALTLNPQDLKAETNLGLTYEMENRSDSAELAYQKAVAIANSDQHTDEWPYLNYASFLLEHDRAADAIPLLKRAVAIAPRCADCHGKLGRALTLTGQTAPAIAELRQAVQLSPREAKFHFDLGRAYRAAGEMAEARVELALSAKLYGSKDSTGSK